MTRSMVLRAASQHIGAIPLDRCGLLRTIQPRLLEEPPRLSARAAQVAELRLDANSDVHTFSTEAPWWPPAKIVGRHLTPFLARQLGLAQTDAPAGAEGDDAALEWQPGSGWTPV